MEHISLQEKEDFFTQVDERRPDIQALLIRGYKSLPCARYLLLRIDDKFKAKSYFNWLLANKWITVAQKPKDPSLLTSNGDPKTAVNLAFTSCGLTKLGMNCKTLATFSRQFIEGMDYINPGAEINERSALLGDRGDSDPANWHWGNTDNRVDCLLMLFAEDNPTLNALQIQVYTAIQDGTIIVHTSHTHQQNMDNSKEHFGFRDGISQPILFGVPKAHNREIDEVQKIKPGEVILGLKNEYGSYAPIPFEEIPGIPGRVDLGTNGSYLVFRQIEQHVEKFWHFQYAHSVENGATHQERAVKLAAKMIGRWPEGQSLVDCPTQPCPTDDKDLNNFRYDGPDKLGMKCPIGAHTRRVNPRDQVHTGRDADASLTMSRRHRMLRRGRIYGEPLDENFNIEKILCEIRNRKCISPNEGNNTLAEQRHKKTPIVRGLHFICLVSDIGRQFEFVQNVWANTPTFGDLRNESDPIISPKSPAQDLTCNEFSVPNNTVRNGYKVPEFTTVVGGAYFFMPGLNALKHIFSY